MGPPLSSCSRPEGRPVVVCVEGICMRNSRVLRWQHDLLRPLRGCRSRATCHDGRGSRDAEETPMCKPCLLGRGLPPLPPPPPPPRTYRRPVSSPGWGVWRCDEAAPERSGSRYDLVNGACIFLAASFDTTIRKPSPGTPEACTLRRQEFVVNSNLLLSRIADKGRLKCAILLARPTATVQGVMPMTLMTIGP